MCVCACVVAGTVCVEGEWLEMEQLCHQSVSRPVVTTASKSFLMTIGLGWTGNTVIAMTAHRYVKRVKLLNLILEEHRFHVLGARE